MTGFRIDRLELLGGLVSLAMSASAFGFFDGNKSITVDDGAQAGSQSTVNGSISIGQDATIDGALDTVNGTIRVGQNSRIGEASTVNGSVRLASGVSAGDVASVNGSIRLAGNVVVDGEVSAVNGKITVDRGSRVANDVSNVNGEIRVTQAEIGGNLKTVNGDVWLMDNSVLAGDLVIEEAEGRHRTARHGRKPKVVVGPGSRIDGAINIEHDVELYISETAQVGTVSGVMSLDDAVRFSGSEP